MDSSELIAALPGRTEEIICLLFEAGAQPEEDFLAFKAKHEDRMHSLYIHPQLTEFQNYGPWLLEIDNAERLPDYLASLQGCAAVIVSARFASLLAVQLSRGCTIVQPDGSTELTRFYASHVMEVLAQRADCDWHTFLFNGITQWWFPGEMKWQPLDIIPSEVEMPTNHIIRLDKATWQQITDKPEVTSVLSEWQKMPTSRAFPPCAQRSMVIKALNKSKESGLLSAADQKVYALYYLSGGRQELESDALRAALPNVMNETQSLAEVLVNLADTQY
ncbi:MULTISPECIES: DUF4123 domain-containing protein [Erwiniaceae]|uniref:DUF4123 domain-containing protein n=1 Tax=Erwinia persicina TaxID=55211 RepID=A0ABR8ZQ72_9GAMM|nr:MULTISPECIES: DUF4123 domain-containing protein [Erwiniaceae]MBD8105826.1 DUF4123 domain-containing protein [Erwinia persicina]MBD8209408.1 DUF4123 domain-containing protein [Erwinia persicina]MBD8224149.1 DUF4123 domain-containing protein [Pantoea agglomerans]TKK17065.1 DUF4123 domain-containing protein [Pantoea agglomerans]TKK27190.1 DUF4123 domain-containing protein [Pantoea agglomerans]